MRSTFTCYCVVVVTHLTLVRLKNSDALAARVRQARPFFCLLFRSLLLSRHRSAFPFSIDVSFMLGTRDLPAKGGDKLRQDAAVNVPRPDRVVGGKTIPAHCVGLSFVQSGLTNSGMS
jgi:hypothetical protein